MSSLKKILLILLLLPFVALSQVDYNDVMQLLLKNKREDARKLFDKKFEKIKDNQIDLLFLDAIIEVEMGQNEFDETLLKKIEKFPEAKHFINAFINHELVMGDVNSDGFNDLTFQKIDFLAGSKVFQDLSIVKYRKAVADRKRLRWHTAKTNFESLGAITAWQFCGPFENMNGSGLHIEYDPETNPKDNQLFNASSNGKLGWYIPKKIDNEGYHFFMNEREYGNGIIYAQTFVEVPESKRFKLTFGTSDGIKVFVDDVEIAIKDEAFKSNLDGYEVELNLSKGMHRILMKVETYGGAYFAAALKNLDYSIPTELKYYNTFQPYSTSTEEALNVAEIKLPFEAYFDGLVQKSPNNVLYRLFQFEAYAANGKKEEAHDAIEGLDELYPKSSLIARYFIVHHGMEGDHEAQIEELMKNMENEDKNYHLVTFYKLNDRDWHSNAPLKELEEYAKLTKTYKNKQYYTLFQLIMASRKSDVDGIMAGIEDLAKNSFNNDKNKLLFANLVKNVKNDNDRYLDILNELFATRLNVEVEDALLNHYQKINDKEKVEQFMKDRMERYFNINAYRNQWIDYLIKENRYQEALEVIDINLSYFPYSFKNFEKKGYVYAQMKNNKEAERYYLKALSHNASDSGLRKKLYDLNDTPDEIEQVETKDVYKVIKNRRNNALKGDYGVTILLDEYIVNILPEGGRKSKVRLIYEVTSETGIENIKEYSINTYSVNMIKNEIVKPNGNLVPGEVGYNGIVFPKLEVGDVIYIEYDYVSNSYGRFYNDFNFSSTSSGEYPVVEFIFGVIYPEGTKLNTFIKNDQIKVTDKKINKKNYKEWRKTQTPNIPIYEKFSPVFSDLVGEVYVGSIETWGDIANWYADLVKKNIKKDKITQQVFKELFPQGHQSLTEDERALRIYKYISENITYSFVDFRQSGHVPQKPSKTITSKLGDCKDVSTLFVALAEMADLEANLVLVLTNDNGLKSMPLPNNEFNHCIARVVLNGKEHFLELTDKYLPFKAMPQSLINAKALVIHFQKAKNDAAQLIGLTPVNAIPNAIHTKTVVDILEDKKVFSNEHLIKGSYKAYFNELFSSATSEDIRKKELVDLYNGRLKKTIQLESAKGLTNDRFSDSYTFESKFSVNERLQKLGSLKVISIPFLDVVYTKALVETDARNYPINYNAYEDSFHYTNELLLKLPKGNKFIEVPESRTLNYKGHQYQISFEVVQDNELKIIRVVKLSPDDIQPSEYVTFKEYIDEVLAIEDQIIGFK